MTKLAKLKENVKLIIIPLIFLATYIFVTIIWELLGLPPREELVSLVTEFFNKYGLLVVFFSALLEGTLLVGNYFPGGIIIFLGVITSIGDAPRAIAVVSVVSLALIIAYLINYAIGRYGWYNLFAKLGLKKSIDKAQNDLSKHELKAVFLAYWHPNLAALVSTAAGILRIKVTRFMVHSIIGIIFWNIFWGLLAYNVGEKTLDYIGIKYIGPLIVVWIFYILIKNSYEKNKTQKVNKSKKQD